MAPPPYPWVQLIYLNSIPYGGEPVSIYTPGCSVTCCHQLLHSGKIYKNCILYYIVFGVVCKGKCIWLTLSESKLFMNDVEKENFTGFLNATSISSDF